MNRRSFIRNTLITLPVLSSTSSILSACEENEININYDGKIIIIGAGASGLYAAHLLQKKGAKNIQILEASLSYGGRIKTLSGFADFPVELGAEEIHGNNNVFYRLAKNAGATFTDESTSDYYFFKNSLKNEQQANTDNDFIAASNLLNNIANYSGDDITVQQHINNIGINAALQPYLNAQIGNEYGTSNQRLSMKGIAEADNLWTAGDEDYPIANKSVLSILEQNFSTILSKIKYDTAVKSIDYSSSKIILKDQNNIEYIADKVIVTVPLSILKSNYIAFNPGLPDSKMTALNKLGMDAGMKVILKFNNRFWANDLSSVFGTGAVPEYWNTALGRTNSNYSILTAFILGEKAETLTALSETQIKNILLSDLDAIYGGTAASSGFSAIHIQDWTKEPFIKGAYSYPKVGYAGAREALAEKLGENLYFAGEATAVNGHFATVHGALETAERSVNELIATIK
ncbi:MAG: NAD(P)/FAD-dependent oxidoreductase [Sphingobacteriales bacterium]|nr:NAD(P)/FAD-dependent oxidoreductase [Sphingobacteriales bacterium]